MVITFKLFDIKIIPPNVLHLLVVKYCISVSVSRSTLDISSTNLKRFKVVIINTFINSYAVLVKKWLWFVLLFVLLLATKSISSIFPYPFICIMQSLFVNVFMRMCKFNENEPT